MDAEGRSALGEIPNVEMAGGDPPIADSLIHPHPDRRAARQWRGSRGTIRHGPEFTAQILPLALLRRFVHLPLHDEASQQPDQGTDRRTDTRGNRASRERPGRLPDLRGRNAGASSEEQHCDDTDGDSAFHEGYGYATRNPSP